MIRTPTGQVLRDSVAAHEVLEAAVEASHFERFRAMTAAEAKARRGSGTIPDEPYRTGAARMARGIGLALSSGWRTADKKPVKNADLWRALDELAAKHYAEHEGKPFYPGLLKYIKSGPVVAMVWEGPNAVATARQLMGKTKPIEAEMGSIRADFAVDVGRNLTHGSDKPETGERETALWFAPEEIVSWSRDNDRWIFE